MRRKLHLDELFNFKIILSCPWCIRSAHSIHAYFIGFVSHRVTYNNVRLNFGILPVCTI